MSRRPLFTLALALALVGGRLTGQTVFGTTATSLVTVDVNTGTTTNVGALNLPANSMFASLTWQPGEQWLYGIVFTVVSDVITNHYLAKIDPGTGAASTIVSFGDFANNLPYEAITFVPGLGSYSFVASRGPANNDTSTSDLVTMTTTGDSSPLVSTTVDNDVLAYDGLHSVLYTMDPNGPNILRTVNITTGATMDIGAGISTLTGLAYSPFANRLYGVSYMPGDNSLYVLDPANAALLTTLTTSGSQLTALAVAIPEPAAWAALAASVGLALAAARSGAPSKRERG